MDQDLLPISAPVGVAPPEPDSDDEKAVIDHVGALLIGAQSWLELIQEGPEVLRAVNQAIDAVLNLGAGT